MLIQALYIALIAVVYAVILIESGMLFSMPYQKLQNWTLATYNKYPSDIWWLKPLISCVRCVAGQIAFWTFFYIYEYNLLLHITFTALAIYFSTILNKIYQWTQQP
jgi:hypothetical protein